MGAVEGSCHCGRVRWTLAALPAQATACSCTACRRYGALWAYGNLGTDITITGETHAYTRDDIDQCLAFHFCPHCGGMVAWLPLDGEGRCAVNLRLAEPDVVADVAIHRWDGFDTWATVPSEGRTVAHVWF